MFNLTADTQTFVDIEKKMVLRKPESWDDPNNFGEGDALHRTGTAYIAYGEEILKEGVLSCFTRVDENRSYYYQAARCYPNYGEDDVSRDQVIMALASLKFNNNMDELKEIGPKLKYRLSKKFCMTPALWLWIRMICTDSNYYNTLYGIMQIIEFVPAVIWSKLIRPFLKHDTEYELDWYMSIDPTTGLWEDWNGYWEYLEHVDSVNNGYKITYDNRKYLYDNKFLNLLSETEFPEYASNLTCNTVQFMKEGFLKKILRKFIFWNSDKSNWLFHLILGEDIPIEDINAYKPTKSTRWSNHLNGTFYTEYLSGDDAIYNVMDKDLLYAHKK